MYQNAAMLAAFLLSYSAVAGRVERSWISGPIVFTAVGFILGPDGLSVLHIKISGEGLRLLAELTLAMVLLTDAANADFGVVRRNLGLPERLLLIGLPLTIVLGFLFAAIVFPSLATLELALLAAMLAPTDAALEHLGPEVEAKRPDVLVSEFVSGLGSDRARGSPVDELHDQLHQLLGRSFPRLLEFRHHCLLLFLPLLRIAGVKGFTTVITQIRRQTTSSARMLRSIIATLAGSKSLVRSSLGCQSSADMVTGGRSSAFFTKMHQHGSDE